MGCAAQTLKLLPKEVLTSLAGLCDKAVIGLQALKTAKQAAIATIDIQLIPLQAKRALLNNVVDGVRESVQIIPVELIIQCPELGNINTMLEQSIVAQVESAINIVFEIDRMISIKAELNATLQDIDNAIDYFQSLSIDVSNALRS